jgi:hypothetical protein
MDRPPDEPQGNTAAHGAAPELIEVHVGTLRQLFNSMDPSPFRDRDLDPRVDDYIVEWARETPASQPLGLVVHLSHQEAHVEDTTLLQQAVREYFTERAASERRNLRRLLRTGRISLVIGILFLGVAIVLGDLVSGLVGRYDYGEIIAHSLLIGGWVALWRPIEIFLYDWWPIRAEARLYDRLSAMSVRLVSGRVATA